jgi:hypothetical protein
MYDMHHALFCIDMMARRVMLSQHFVTHVVPPLPTTNPLNTLMASVYLSLLSDKQPEIHCRRYSKISEE